MNGIVGAFIIGLVIGAGGGYAIAWNAALHPGKLAAQASALWKKLRGRE